MTRADNGTQLASDAKGNTIVLIPGTEALTREDVATLMQRAHSTFWQLGLED